MLFTADQLRRVREIIRRYHSAVGISVFGPPAHPGDVDKLREALLDPTSPNLIDDTQAYAGLMAQTGDYGLMTKTPAEIVRLLESTTQPGLSPAERAAADQAARHAGQYMTGLSDRVTSSVMGAVTAAESNLAPDQVRQIVADTTAKNRIRRETVSSLKKELRDNLPGYERDFQRLATTETNNAIQDGAAVAIAHKGDDPNVSKIPGPGACPDCLRLYTSGGEPIVFKLSELQANGSNVGRKRVNWLPVVESVHPWCACVLVSIPKGMRWDGNELTPDKATKSLTGSPYKLAYRTTFQDLPISIENRKGSYRRWEDPKTGESGKNLQHFPYGYIRGVEGKDGDEIDVYVGPDDDATHAYVVHQRIKDGDSFYGHDEDKVMLGFSNKVSAKKAYLRHFDDPRFFGAMTAVPMPRFKRIIEKNKGKRLVLWKSSREYELPSDPLIKALFIGPRGGRWADAKHTIPYAQPHKKALFHSAPAHDMESIQSDGLRPRKGGGLFSHGVYGTHSQGKVFLSDNFDAAHNWHGKVEDQLFAQHDDSARHVAVMMRVKDRRTKRDEVGDNDVAGSRYVEKTIPPEHIEYHDREQGWRPISAWEPGAHVTPVDEEDAHHPGTEAARIIDDRREAEQVSARRFSEGEKRRRDLDSKIEAARKEWSGKPATAREAKAAELLAMKSPIPNITHLDLNSWRIILGVDKAGKIQENDLQKAPFFRDAYDIKIRGMRLGAKPDRYLSFVQGTDDSPRPTRPSDLTGQADEMGLTVKGKKKRKKEKEQRNRDRSAQAKTKRASLDVFDLMRRPTGQDNEVATARDYVPQTLKDLRAEMHRLSRKDNHKVQLILAERKRRSGNRVSEAETMKHFRDKKNKKEGEP